MSCETVLFVNNLWSCQLPHGVWLKLKDRESCGYSRVVKETFSNIHVAFVHIVSSAQRVTSSHNNTLIPIYYCSTYTFILRIFFSLFQNSTSLLWHLTGNAGFRLHFPAHFELFGDPARRQVSREEEINGMEQLPQQQPVVRSVEACIGQKLQLIGDQFHREHLQLVRRSYSLYPANFIYIYRNTHFG